MPVAMAIPPTSIIRKPFRNGDVRVSLALSNPRVNKAMHETATETGRAISVDQKPYGRSTKKPDKRYEVNIMTAEISEDASGTAMPFRNSRAELSDKRLPMHIENASTNTKISPVSRIVDLGTPTMAIPDTSPTVETRLSSTPNTKFLR
jgi:hypothetical protein